MVAAILIGLLTCVAIIAIAIIVYRLRKAHKNTHASSSYGIETVETVGVGSSGEQDHRAGLGPNGGAQHVKRSAMAGGGSPAESLRYRFTALGILSAAIFGTLGVKLWSMQVLDNATYSKEAEENLYTTVNTPAPRGIIYDANGVALAQNRSSYTVLADAEVASNRDVMLRLSGLLGVPYEVIRKRVLDTTGGAQSQRVVESDASRRSLSYIAEHIDAFPGISTEARTTREYPWGAVAAQLLGYVTTANDEAMANATEGRDLKSGDIVGSSGIESQYDDLLAGNHGSRVLITDADGNIERVVSHVDPTKGNDIYLTLRAPVQLAADRRMREILTPDGVIGKGNGSGSGMVCIDISNGDIVAMSSAPTFTPESFVGGIETDLWDSLNSTKSGYPLMNRAIAGAYPAASTFKGFTSTAALQAGLINKDWSTVCTGTWTGFGTDFPQNCWELSGHGDMDIVHGIAQSCDVVFYEIAKAFYDNSATLGPNALQEGVMQFGLGSLSGIDLPGEVAGRIPTPEWKAEYYKDTPTEGAWQPGDMSNMVIGQGYVLVTPLQIALGYCGLATGGTIMKPHVLKEVKNSLGETVISYQSEVLHQFEINDETKRLVQEGLTLVPEYNSTVSNAFSDFSWSYACKTGTAEVEGKKDFGWLVAYAPADKPRYCCACVVEEGDGGAHCAPICAATLGAALSMDAGTFDTTMGRVEGTSSSTLTDRGAMSASSTGGSAGRTD